jgi:acyl-CoA synthetase (AMP-forming)/AMP-acid ligase II
VLSTMQDWPLTVASILEHRRAVHGTATVATAGEDGVTYSSFQETAERAARLAGALEALGVERDDRVATFQRNNSAHVEAYFAVPAMGAILPTVNIRRILEPPRRSSPNKCGEVRQERRLGRRRLGSLSVQKLEGPRRHAGRDRGAVPVARIARRGG